MSMQNVKTNVDFDIVTIKVSGKFNFDMREQFRNAYRSHPRNKRFVVELFRVTHIDSSALGMLLVLLEYAGGRKDNLHLVGCTQEVKKLLDIAQFEKLMTIT